MYKTNYLAQLTLNNISFLYLINKNKCNNHKNLIMTFTFNIIQD